MIVRKIKDIIKGIYWVYFSSQEGFHKEEKRIQNVYYSKFKVDAGVKTSTPSVVFMIDGRSIHGGLSDRLRGICSIYGYCKKRDIPFYIHAVYPFNLQDYLEPNIVDWQISEYDISYNLYDSIPVCINDYQFSTTLHPLYLNKLVQKNKQIHVYSNTDFDDIHYAQNFHELFKPSSRLQQAIDENLKRIGKPYIAMVFRFQQLLGDFKEEGYKILESDERIILIKKCVDKVKELHHRLFSNEQILVTADSITFLNEINKLDYVSIIPGRVVHMDHTADASYDVYLKSFVDMFMLSKAKKVFLLQTDDMYHSGFAKRSAMINNVPYEEIIF